MAFTEFFVTQTSASDVNGGSSATVIDNPAAVTAVHDGSGSHTLTDDGVDGFSNTAVDDVLCWDVAGAKEFGIVTSITSSDIIVVLNLGGAVAFTNLTSKAVNVGGAWATLQHAADTVDTGFVNAAGDLPFINIKIEAGDYTEGGIQFDTNAGTVAIPISAGAYTSTPHDIDWMTETARAKFDHDGTSAYVIQLAVAHVRLFDLDLENTGTNNDALAFTTTGDFARLHNIRCKSVNADGISPSSAANNCYFLRCVIEDCGNNGVSGRMGADAFWIGCTIRNNTGFGVNSGDRQQFLNCAIYGNGGVGIAHNANRFTGKVQGCLIADNGGDGLDLGTEADLEILILLSNIIAHNGGFGINGSAGSPAPFTWQDYNTFNSNTSGNINAALIDDSQHNKTDTQPFTETTAATRKSSGDYSLVSGIKELGWPGEIGQVAGDTAANFTGFNWPGPLEPQEPAGGGGGGIIGG